MSDSVLCWLILWQCWFSDLRLYVSASIKSVNIIFRTWSISSVVQITVQMQNELYTCSEVSEVCYIRTGVWRLSLERDIEVRLFADLRYSNKRKIWKILKHFSVMLSDMGGGTFFKVGGHKCTLKRNYNKFCGLNWQLWRHRHWSMMSLPVHHMKV